MSAEATAAARIIAAARSRGQRFLSEHEAKQLLSRYGIPVTRETLVGSRDAVVPAARDLGYPVALKACSAAIAHKTEKGLVRLDVRGDAEALEAYDRIVDRMGELPGAVLVQEMVEGGRELAAGLVRDAQFGPCVMLGLGGIFTEILEDATFRKAPLQEADALEMMDELRGRRLLDEGRGGPAADRRALAHLVTALGRIGLDHEAVQEIDANPVILAGSRPVVADALVVLG